MADSNNGKYDHLISLDEKIVSFFSTEPFFSAVEVKKRFPDENERAIYRALNKLETTQRIRFLRWANKRKVYTTSGTSNLPMLKSAAGDIFPMSKLLSIMETLHHEDGRFKGLDDVDDMIIVIMQLFIIAQDDDEKEMKRNFLIAHRKLVDIKTTLQRFMDNIDAVIKHPGMQGEMGIFKRTFDNSKDPDMPTPEELLRFRTWLAKLRG